jgi:hypothetical protein
MQHHQQIKLLLMLFYPGISQSIWRIEMPEPDKNKIEPAKPNPAKPPLPAEKLPQSRIPAPQEQTSKPQEQTPKPQEQKSVLQQKPSGPVPDPPTPKEPTSPIKPDPKLPPAQQQQIIDLQNEKKRKEEVEKEIEKQKQAQREEKLKKEKQNEEELKTQEQARVARQKEIDVLTTKKAPNETDFVSKSSPDQFTVLNGACLKGQSKIKVRVHAAVWQISNQFTFVGSPVVYTITQLKNDTKDGKVQEFVLNSYLDKDYPENTALQRVLT